MSWQHFVDLVLKTQHFQTVLTDSNVLQANTPILNNYIKIHKAVFTATEESMYC